VRTAQVCNPDRPDLNRLIVRAVEHVLDNTHLMGRWQVIDEKPLTICDTGHNSGGFAYIAAQLERLECRRLHVVIGFVSDKDVDSIIRLLPKRADYTVVRASVDRAMDPQLLADKMLAAGLSVRVSDGGVFETYGKVRDEAGPEDAIYIGGSTFVVADLLAGFVKNGNL
jgi:dihydrofolate synthase/folylpolyglutamate synthase